MNRAPMSSAQLEQQFQARIAQAKEAARLASIAAAARSQGASNGPPLASAPAVPGVPFRPPPIHANAPASASRFAAAPEPAAVDDVPSEVRNRIDRLVEFVARNGDAFEATARQRERDNPDFAFLRPGGPFSDYYQWKKQQACGAQPPPAGAPTGFVPSPPPRAPFGSPNAVQAQAPPMSIDPLGGMSVGAMANVCKFARLSGVPAYAPIPREVVASVGSLPPVEPARLEIRLSEFYRDEERN
ncbi:Calcium homeostasis endoplasmic reticulum protein [Phytophthora cinnamomi]|uniref:Calcium homeostasis endoplasmic reticulum protein n=1 Tax=Phytophthora cinnamomi TaxID=4785 RepID=UPI0035599BD1|nr:Calcium homeostasis endoplasmic reticulum protein [Phytophthora cinnamomi]